MEKQRWKESEKRKEEERRSEKRKGEKKEDPGARKGRKVAKHSVFQMFWGSGRSKSRLAKAAGTVARRSGAKQIVARSRLWREARSQVKSAKN
jgi:hypothetical protein